MSETDTINNTAQIEYGPFYRLQNAEANALMESSSIVGGTYERNIYAGLVPKAKAFVGHLPAGRAGIEFYTSVPPSGFNRFDAPDEKVYWSQGDPGVIVIDASTDLVGVPVRIVRRVD